MDVSQHVRALTLWVGALVDELVRGEVTEWVVCPGSRSTPLALAVARHPDAHVWMQLDERSGAFFALGLAKQSGRPAALLCTSGTAAANFLPAVAEADLARVPLLVLTADRPPELRDNGAPQTIDQVRLFGSRTRWFSDLPTPADTPDLLRYARAVAGRALAASLTAPAGPVHLNLPFREPLVPDRALLATVFQEAGRPGGQLPPYATALPGELPRRGVSVAVGSRVLVDQALKAFVERLSLARRGLILCGPGCPPDLAPAVVKLATHLGYPILADPLSGVRCGPHLRQLVLAAYDAFLRDETFATTYAPELVLRFGAMPTAKPVLQYLQRYPTAYQVVVDEGAGWREPTSLAAEHLACDPVWLCEAVTDTLMAGDTRELWITKDANGERTTRTRRSEPREQPEYELLNTPAHGEAGWLPGWLKAEHATRGVIEATLRERTALNEPGVFAELAALLPDGATLFVGNSMPVRDCDTFFPGSERRVTIMGNRGANGIDGLVSTALGAAAAGARPMVLALGDISLYHDSNGLLTAKLHGLAATVVLLNNDGGGIFSFLPQAGETDQFELLFGTPHGLDFRPLAELYGACYTLAESWEAFQEAVRTGVEGRGLHLVEVRTERGQNVADHRDLWPRVSAALRAAAL